MNHVLTRDQIRRVDQLAVQRYAIPGLILMENAGRNAAGIICDEYGPNGKVFVWCGPGNNGGDGCVIARHLHNAGWSVRLVITAGVSRMTEDTKVNYAIVDAMAIDTRVVPDAEGQRSAAGSVDGDEVLVDALLGTGFQGEVRAPTAELIDLLNAVDKRALVAVDVPSGLDCQTGVPSNATIRADLTITFVASKAGFTRASAAPHTGRIVVADIGAPRELVEDIATGRS
jgi:NAD(P)H-hydrate epimerase